MGLVGRPGCLHDDHRGARDDRVRVATAVVYGCVVSTTTKSDRPDTAGIARDDGDDDLFLLSRGGLPVVGAELRPGSVRRRDVHGGAHGGRGRLGRDRVDRRAHEPARHPRGRARPLRGQGDTMPRAVAPRRSTGKRRRSRRCVRNGPRAAAPRRSTGERRRPRRCVRNGRRRRSAFEGASPVLLVYRCVGLSLLTALLRRRTDDDRCPPPGATRRVASRRAAALGQGDLLHGRRLQLRLRRLGRQRLVAVARLDRGLRRRGAVRQPECAAHDQAGATTNVERGVVAAHHTSSREIKRRGGATPLTPFLAGEGGARASRGAVAAAGDLLVFVRRSLSSRVFRGARAAIIVVRHLAEVEWHDPLRSLVIFVVHHIVVAGLLGRGRRHLHGRPLQRRLRRRAGEGGLPDLDQLRLPLVVGPHHRLPCGDGRRLALLVDAGELPFGRRRGRGNLRPQKHTQLRLHRPPSPHGSRRLRPRNTPSPPSSPSSPRGSRQANDPTEEHNSRVPLSLSPHDGSDGDHIDVVCSEGSPLPSNQHNELSEESATTTTTTTRARRSAGQAGTNTVDYYGGESFDTSNTGSNMCGARERASEQRSARASERRSVRSR